MFNSQRKMKKQVCDNAEIYKIEINDDKQVINQKEAFDYANSHRKSMQEHGDKYTELLDTYISNVKESLEMKREHKGIFFCVTISALIASMALFFIISIIIVIVPGGTNVDYIIAIAPSFVSLLSMFIIIPKTIAKYLFNIKEDNNMTKVVKSIQKYDAEVDSHYKKKKKVSKKCNNDDNLKKQEMMSPVSLNSVNQQDGQKDDESKKKKKNK